jgi:hypothetical protein
MLCRYVNKYIYIASSKDGSNFLFQVLTIIFVNKFMDINHMKLQVKFPFIKIHK